MAQVVPHPPACAPYGSSEYFTYGYQPSLATGIIFSIIFGVITIVQIQYMLRYRAWWMFFLVAGAGLDTLGWLGRAIAHDCVFSDTINTLQIATLIMGPAWTQAGVYIALWILIKAVGEQISPLSPRVYLWICVCVDTVCLSMQATGGGLAGSAVDANQSPQTGTDLMLAGIIAQLVCGCVFFLLLVWVLWRGRHLIAANRLAFLVSISITISTLMMILRGFYRSIELAQGWTGYLITHERYIIGLDAVPMVIAMGTLAILSPGPLLAKYRDDKSGDIEKTQHVSEELTDGSPVTVHNLVHSSKTME